MDGDSILIHLTDDGKAIAVTASHTILYSWRTEVIA